MTKLKVSGISKYGIYLIETSPETGFPKQMHVLWAPKKYHTHIFHRNFTSTYMEILQRIKSKVKEGMYWQAIGEDVVVKTLLDTHGLLLSENILYLLPQGKRPCSLPLLNVTQIDTYVEDFLKAESITLAFKSDALLVYTQPPKNVNQPILICYGMYQKQRAFEVTEQVKDGFYTLVKMLLTRDDGRQSDVVLGDVTIRVQKNIIKDITQSQIQVS